MTYIDMYSLQRCVPTKYSTIVHTYMLSALGEKKKKRLCIFRLKEVVAGEEIYVNHMYWKKAKTIKSVSSLFLF